MDFRVNQAAGNASVEMLKKSSVADAMTLMEQAGRLYAEAVESLTYIESRIKQNETERAHLAEDQARLTDIVNRLAPVRPGGEVRDRG